MLESEIYNLEKSIWTEEDFSQMGWHDSRIHAVCSVVLNENEPWINKLSFDIDYIFQWVNPTPPDQYFTFWVSPCTLIFENYYDLKINADLSFSSMIEIADLNLIDRFNNEHNNQIYYSWEIELQGGLISLKSKGFKQIIRKKPVFTESQGLTFTERGGISFSSQPC